MTLDVKAPSSSTGSDGTITCTYAPTTSEFADGPVTVTYTPNATAANVAAARAKATSDGFTGFTDLSGIGDAGFLARKASADSDTTTYAGAEQGGQMITVSSFGGVFQAQTFLMEEFGDK